jgi:pantoate kinase
LLNLHTLLSTLNFERIERMETKSETTAAITLTREELKALIKEAVKEALTEILKQPSESLQTEHDRRVAEILERHLMRYRKVWEALA